VYLREELAARGVRRAVVAGDLNTPNPGDVFGKLDLVDAFGDAPPATTPDGRSIDRLFSARDLITRGVSVIQLPGADHYPVVCRLARRPPEARSIGRIREQDLTRPPTRPGSANRGLTR
jgi:endonuclease/exonuclease/phosphatase family metal-dependent hydrolase